MENFVVTDEATFRFFTGEDARRLGGLEYNALHRPWKQAWRKVRAGQTLDGFMKRHGLRLLLNRDIQ